MKIITWNVNGLRSHMKEEKGTWKWIMDQKPDVICLQELKSKPEQLTDAQMETFKGYQVAWNPAEKPGYSGVATIPVTDLDTRDMGVFDVVIVANDTGTSTSDWGGGVPARAIAIAASTANVLALGDGGLAYLQLAVSSISGAASQTRSQTSYYAVTPAASVFTTPHSVTGGGGPQWVDISSSPQPTIGVAIDSAAPPAGVNLRACTGLNNDIWALVDFQVPDIFSTKKRLFFWGHGGDPKQFRTEGENLLGNIMYLLYNDRAIVPPVTAPR